jgi:hypothetical protein
MDGPLRPQAIVKLRIVHRILRLIEPLGTRRRLLRARQAGEKGFSAQPSSSSHAPGISESELPSRSLQQHADPQRDEQERRSGGHEQDEPDEAEGLLLDGTIGFCLGDASLTSFVELEKALWELLGSLGCLLIQRFLRARDDRLHLTLLTKTRGDRLADPEGERTLKTSCGAVTYCPTAGGG